MRPRFKAYHAWRHRSPAATAAAYHAAAARCAASSSPASVRQSPSMMSTMLWSLTCSGAGWARIAARAWAAIWRPRSGRPLTASPGPKTTIASARMSGCSLACDSTASSAASTSPAWSSKLARWMSMTVRTIGDDAAAPSRVAIASGSLSLASTIERRTAKNASHSSSVVFARARSSNASASSLRRRPRRFDQHVDGVESEHRLRFQDRGVRSQ